jgi:hypothetical protein
MNSLNPDFVGPASQRRWAGVADAAEYAACGLTKFWKMMQSGSIFAVRNGGKIVVDLNSIDAFYEHCEPVAKRLPVLDELSLSAGDLGLALPDSEKFAHESVALPTDNPPSATETRHGPALADVDSFDGGNHE